MKQTVHRATALNMYLLLVSAMIISVLFVLLAGARPTSAATPPESCFEYTTTGGTATITRYYLYEGGGTSGTLCPRGVDIPDTLGGHTVTAIGNGSWCSGILNSAPAFACKGLTSVSIPDTVIDIGQTSFMNNQLTSVVIGGSVESIGASAFYGNQLTSISIPGSVANIGDSAFSTNQLTSLVIPDSVDVIGSFAFGYNQLTSVTIPNSATSISDGVFVSNQLTSVIIPASVESIGYNAFAYNKLTTVTIPGSVTSIGLAAFFFNHLTTVVIHGNPVLGEYVFAWNGLDWPVIDEETVAEELLEYYLENVEFVHLYATDLDFVANNQDAVYPPLDIFPFSGGYLINPAQAQVAYQNSANQPLSATRTFIGSNAVAQDYRLVTFLDLSDPDTLAFNTILLNSLYRLGQAITITPPDIDGYVTPAAFTTSLGSPTTTIPVTYLTQSELGDGTTTNPDGSVTPGTNTPGVPNTGLQRTSEPNSLVFIALVTTLVVSAIAACKYRHHNKA